jgi:thiol:disulfide interchange protein DsbD
LPKATTKSEPAAANPVRIYLLADVTSIAPGQELSIATRFDIEPGWHIYWENPGDTGLKTEVSFIAPEDFQVGPVRYPGPERFDSPGDVTSYGYHDLVVLSANVVAPEKIDSTSLRFAVAANWLACRESCIRGQANAETTIAVASAENPSGPANDKLLAGHADKLPKPITELAGVTHEWKPGTGTAVDLTLVIPGDASVDFFPSSTDQPLLAGKVAIPGDGKVTLRLTYHRNAATDAVRRGIVAVAQGDQTLYYGVDLPWPKDVTP